MNRRPICQLTQRRKLQFFDTTSYSAQSLYVIVLRGRVHNKYKIIRGPEAEQGEAGLMTCEIGQRECVRLQIYAEGCCAVVSGRRP